MAAGSMALTPNRDGFCGDVGEEFTRLISGLVQDQKSLRLGNAMELSLNFDSTTTLPDAGVADACGYASKYVFNPDTDCAATGADAYARTDSFEHREFQAESGGIVTMRNIEPPVGGSSV